MKSQLDRVSDRTYKPLQNSCDAGKIQLISWLLSSSFALRGAVNLSVVVNAFGAPFPPPQAHVRMLVAINRPYAAEDESVFRFTTLPVRDKHPGPSVILSSKWI
jgi:hypothetical protein